MSEKFSAYPDIKGWVFISKGNGMRELSSNSHSDIVRSFHTISLGKGMNPSFPNQSDYSYLSDTSYREITGWVKCFNPIRQFISEKVTPIKKKKHKPPSCQLHWSS